MKSFQDNSMPSQRPSTPLSPKIQSPQIPQQVQKQYVSTGPPLQQHRLQLEKMERILRSILPWKETVLECVQNREMILDRIQKISAQNFFEQNNHKRCSYPTPSNLQKKRKTVDSKKQEHIHRLICGLRDASLCVVEAIQEWSRKMKSFNIKIDDNEQNVFVGHDPENSPHQGKHKQKKKNKGKVRFADLPKVSFLPPASTDTSMYEDKNTCHIPNKISEQTMKLTDSNQSSNSILRKPQKKSNLCNVDNLRCMNDSIIFRWKGENYLTKMMSDTKTFKNLPFVSEVLGPSYVSDRNPFLLPYATIDDTLLKIKQRKASMCPIQNHAKICFGENLDMERIESASLLILSQEKHDTKAVLGNCTLNESPQDGPTSLSPHGKHESYLPFPPPKLNRLELQDYSSMPNPPISIATVISCTRLILKCDENSAVGKWNCIPPLTVSMAYMMLRQPIQPIFSKINMFYREYHPHQSISNDVLLALYPIVVNDKMDPTYIHDNISRSIGALAAWVKQVILYEVERRSSLPPIQQIDGEDFARRILDLKYEDKEPILFSEWESQCIVPAKSTKPKKRKKKKKKRIRKTTTTLKHNVNRYSDDELNDGDQEYHKSESWDILTSYFDENKSGNNFRDIKAHTIMCSDIDSEDETKTRNSSHDMTCTDKSSDLPENELVPIPLPFLVSIDEGSVTVKLSASKELYSLQGGDKIRIGNVHLSDDWVVSPSDSGPCVGVEFNLTEPYRNNSLVRSRKASVHIEDNYERRNLNVWKLIPEHKDDRQPWRKQYDDGDVPWIQNFEQSSGCSEHFNVEIGWDVVEESCRDALCDPENHFHEQRVFYFQDVSPWKIIEETYISMCNWHPISKKIDNVKWSKLARKMKFLSKLRNTAHEVDMAFARQIRRRKERKIDLEMFISILQDIATLQYRSLRAQPEEALRKLLWNSVVMLPNVNYMAWTDAKEMAIIVEGRRLCAQIRLASFYRKRTHQNHYFQMKQAVCCISKYVRRRIAMRRKKNILKALKHDHQFRVRYLCAIVCQKTWRRYHSQLFLRRHKEIFRERELEAIKQYRSKMNKQRKLREYTIVFKQIQQIQETFVLVIMMLKDKRPLEKCCYLEITAYLPESQSTFRFTIQENVLCDCLGDALGSNGPLSWNEMLLHSSLHRLTDRLMVRYVHQRPIVLFSKRNINEKGRLISKTSASFSDRIFVLSIYRSSFDVVVCAYDPITCGVLRTSISISKLSDWLQDDESKRNHVLENLRKSLMRESKVFKSNKNGKNLDSSYDEKQNVSQANEHGKQLDSSLHTQKIIHFMQDSHGPKISKLLIRENEHELITWLMKRVSIIYDSKLLRYKLMLQCDAEEDKILWITSKIQSIWRAKVQQRIARQKVSEQYEKAFDREYNLFYYIHKRTGTRQWSKPYLLGSDDLEQPKNEWRKEESWNENNELILVYRNLGTGQTSLFSEENAARMVQRKFREGQSSILLASKVTLATVAKAVKFIRDTEWNYSQSPMKLSNQFNFALLCYCIKLDISLAKPLMKDVYSKNPSHPVIARTYGIFILATCKAPWKSSFETAWRLFREAEAADPGHKMFQMAFDNFFHWSVIVNPRHPMALLNYALVFQCILKNIQKTEKLYRRALAEDHTNTYVLKNFEFFQEERYPGGMYYNGEPSSLVFQRSEVVEEKPSRRKMWGEWNRMMDPLCPKPSFQYFWYDRLTMRAQYEEPDWADVWKKRVKRSKVCKDGENTSSESQNSFQRGWIQFWDEKLDEYFCYNQYTQEYVVGTKEQTI